MSLITPATLSVDPAVHTTTIMTNVPSLGISNPEESHRFAYAPQRKDGSDLQMFLGPRTILARLAVETATTGRILPIRPPMINASYELEFLAPIVSCEDANATIAGMIDLASEEKRLAVGNKSLSEVSIFYYAFVPDLSGQTLNASHVRIANLSDPDGAANSSNQLWMVFRRKTIDSNGNVKAPMHYLTCELWNATYRIQASFVEGIQNLSILDVNKINTVNFPVDDPTAKSDAVQMSYSAFAWAQNAQLVGSLGFFRDLNLKNKSKDNTTIDIFSEITTNIKQTSLLGSSDLDAFFEQNHALYPSKDDGKISDQRAEDIMMARNRTLDVLIEELSSNFTLSLMSSNLLS